MINSILELSSEELRSYLAGLGEAPYRTEQITKGIYSQNYDDFDQFTAISKPLRSRLSADFQLRTFEIVDTIKSEADNTTKFLWKLSDGLQIESVIIYEGRRVTFCISSQAGCPLDCRFCATGKMGLLRNLTCGEIVEQVLQMKALSIKPPTNIVFMGMGEPMLNFKNVLQAADILSDPQGLAFGRKKITISTSGISKGIYKMADEGIPYSLAVSLNAVSQDVRLKIMPIAKKYPLQELLKAVHYYTKKTKKRVTFEYVLINKINSSAADAHKLLELTEDIPCKINIIPCNSDDPNYQQPDEETIEQFDTIMNQGPKAVTIRSRKGWDIRAACGQLYAANDKFVRKRE